MPIQYFPTSRYTGTEVPPRLSRISRSLTGANRGMPQQIPLPPDESLDIQVSPTESDVDRGIVNYLFRDGSVSPEQYGRVDLTLVDPIGSVDPIAADGTETVYYFKHTPDPTSDTTQLQGFKLNTSTLNTYDTDFSTVDWAVNIQFKFDTGSTGDRVIINPSGDTGKVGLYANGNNLKFSSATAGKIWITNTAPVSDDFQDWHRILLRNNTSKLSLYVDGTLQTMKDQATGLETGTEITLGLANTPTAAEYTIGNSDANILRFFLTDSSTGYEKSYCKYIEIHDNLPVSGDLNTAFSTTIPEQASSRSDEQIRNAIRIRSTQDNANASGFVWPANIGLSGRSGAIELVSSNAVTFKSDQNGTVFGYRDQAVIAINTTIRSDYVNVRYGVRTNATSAVTITLPAFDRLVSGDWINFYDISGNAGSKNVTINPDNANTGFTINGSASNTTIIDTNWAEATLYYDFYGNWRLIQDLEVHTNVLSCTGNYTIPAPAAPYTLVVGNQGVSVNTITLPLASTSAGKTIKIVSNATGNSVFSNVVPSGSDTIGKSQTSYPVFGTDAVELTSDGVSIWWPTVRIRPKTIRTSAPLAATMKWPNQYFVSTSNANWVVESWDFVTGDVYQNTLVAFKNANTGSSRVTVQQPTSKIDGAASFNIKGKYSSLMMLYDGTEFHTISYVPRQVRSVTSSNTLSWPDGTILVNSNSGALTITLPLANDYTEYIIRVKKTDSSANVVTIDGNGSETIDGAANTTLSAQYDAVTIVSDGSNWHILSVYP